MAQPQEYEIKDREGFFDFCRRRAWWYGKGPLVSYSVGALQPTIPETSIQSAVKLIQERVRTIAISVIDYMVAEDIPITSATIRQAANNISTTGVIAFEVGSYAQARAYLTTDPSDIPDDFIKSHSTHIVTQLLTTAYGKLSRTEQGMHPDTYSTVIFVQALKGNIANIMSPQIRDSGLTPYHLFESYRRCANHSLNAIEGEAAIAAGAASYLQAAFKIRGQQDVLSPVFMALATCLCSYFGIEVRRVDDIGPALNSIRLDDKSPNIRPVHFLHKLETVYLPRQLNTSQLDALKDARNDIIDHSSRRAGLGSSKGMAHNY